MNKHPLQALASLMTDKFIAADPKAAAAALALLATHEVLLLVGSLKAQSLVRVINPMDPPKAAAVLRRLPFKQASYVLAHLDVPQAAKLWKEFAAPYQERLKEVLPPSFVGLLTQARGFAPGSVGSKMTTDLLCVRTEQKVADLIARLQTLPRAKLPKLCFVTGKNEELKGIIRTVEIMFLNPAAVCGSVMNKPVHVLHPQMDLATARSIFVQAETEVLPVLDEEGRLIGALAKEATAGGQAASKRWWKRLKLR